MNENDIVKIYEEFEIRYKWAEVVKSGIKIWSIFDTLKHTWPMTFKQCDWTINASSIVNSSKEIA